MKSFEIKKKKKLINNLDELIDAVSSNGLCFDNQLFEKEYETYKKRIRDDVDRFDSISYIYIIK